MLSKKELKSLGEIVRGIIKEEVPTMVKREINIAFAWHLPDYVTRKEYEQGTYELKRTIGSLQDTVIGLNDYVRTEFPVFKHDLEEVKAEVRGLGGRMNKLEEKIDKALFR